MLTIGSSTTLQLSIPANGERNWGNAIRTDCFQRISDHDHEANSGSGKKLRAYAALDLTTSILTNNTYLMARNAANTSNKNILKLSSNDVDIVLGDTGTPSATTTRVSNLIMKNNTFIQAVDAAGTAAQDIAKVNASDKVVIGNANVRTVSGDAMELTGVSTIGGTAIAVSNLASLAGTGVTATGFSSIAGTAIAVSDLASLSGTNVAVSGVATITGTNIVADNIKELNTGSSIALADNQVAAADTGITTALAADKAIIVEYKIVRGTATQRGVLVADKDSGSLSDRFTGTDAGVRFVLDADLVKYTSTSTGNVPTLYYQIRRA